MSAVLVPVVALLLAYGVRASASRTAAIAARTATIGYGLPGSVVAVAVIVPLGWLERRIDGVAGTGLLLTGTVIGLFYAYLVRFLALAWGAIEASLLRIPRQLDDAARGLGADRLDVLARVHVPLLRTGLITAALLVFVEVMKELPATLLLRPLGGDTLAIAVWQATTESLFKTAALPALLIVLVGLLPVALMIRMSGRVRRRRGGGVARPRRPGSTSPRWRRYEPRAGARAVEVVRRGRGRPRAEPRDRARRADGGARAVRLRQDDAAAGDRRLRAARRGLRRGLRRGRGRPRPDRSRPRSGAWAWCSRTTRCSRT